MQTNGTECMIDASYHLEKKRLCPKKTTALVNRQGGFEGVSTLATPRTLSVHMNFNLFSQSYKIAESGRKSISSHLVREQKKKHLRKTRKCLIFRVDQPGLEPGTSRL